MTRPFAIAQVSAGDDAALDAVAALEADAFSNPWTRAMLERELRESRVARLYTLSFADGSLGAFCSCWVVAGELHVITLAVRHDRRRGGIGTALMRHVLDAVRREGVRSATLEVRRSNTAALALYERLGFRQTAIRARYYTQPEEDAVILWRDEDAPSGSP